MDDFKINAAKMIAAQQRKNRAQSPETESNWDSSEQEDDDVPHISSEEDSFRHTPKKQALAKNNNKSYSNSLSQGSSPSSKSRNVVKQERQSNRTSPSLSTRSSNKNQKAVNVFVDNGFDSDENESISSTIKRRPKEEVPPYDFRGVVKGAGDPVKDTSQPTGKQRKGQLYDAPAKQQSTNASVDSDEERQMLAEIRTEMKKVQKTHLDVPKGDVRQRFSDSQPTFTKSTPKMLKAKKDKKRRKSESHSINDVPPDPSRQEPAGQGVTTSDVDVYQKLGNTGSERFELEEVATSNKNYPSPPSGDNQIGARYVYYYEHGSLEYHDTRKGRDDIYMANIADKSEKLVRRGVQEFFAGFRILVDFLLILVLETVRFIAFNIIQMLIVGVFSVLGDYLLKPILAGLFNSILQPISTFVYNIAVAMRTVMIPIGDTMKIILTPVIMLVRAFRLFEINWRSSPPTRLHPVEDV